MQRHDTAFCFRTRGARFSILQPPAFNIEQSQTMGETNKHTNTESHRTKLSEWWRRVKPLLLLPRFCPLSGSLTNSQPPDFITSHSDPPCPFFPSPTLPLQLWTLKKQRRLTPLSAAEQSCSTYTSAPLTKILTTVTLATNKPKHTHRGGWSPLYVSIICNWMVMLSLIYLYLKSGLPDHSSSRR